MPADAQKILDVGVDDHGAACWFAHDQPSMHASVPATAPPGPPPRGARWTPGPACRVAGLALLVVQNPFSRNLFRNDARAYAQEDVEAQAGAGRNRAQC